MSSKLRMRKLLLGVLTLSLTGCVSMPSHFHTTAGRVLETVTAVGAAAAGEAASHGRNDLAPQPAELP